MLVYKLQIPFGETDAISPNIRNARDERNLRVIISKNPPLLSSISPELSRPPAHQHLGTLESLVGVLRSEGGPGEHTSISPEEAALCEQGTPSPVLRRTALSLMLLTFRCAGSSLPCEGVSLHGFCCCTGSRPVGHGGCDAQA